MKSKKKHRRRKRSRSSSNSSHQLKKPELSHHFDPAPTKTLSWDQPEDMAKYINKNTSKFITYKTLSDSILEENPVPTNVLSIPKLDDYLLVMLEGKKKYMELTRERSLNRIQGKIRDILRPLSRVWEAVSSFTSSREEDTTFDAAEVKSALDKSVVLVGLA